MTLPPQGEPSPPSPGPHPGQAAPHPIHPAPHPGQAAPHPGQPAPPAAQPPHVPPAPKKRHGVLIASLALAVALLLCAGGGTTAFLLLRGMEEGEGAAEPVIAVEEFLTAVYEDKDAERAASLVCTEARDREAIAKKIAEIEKYESTYEDPRFRWDEPTVDEQNEERAVVSVQLTVTTQDEKIATQRLTFTVVKKTGWWVCEVG